MQSSILPNLRALTGLPDEVGWNAVATVDYEGTRRWVLEKISS